MSKLLLVISCLIASGIAAQGENNNWFFGYQAGLDFSTVPPTPATGQLSTLEGCATVSDASGNLLFYTDGMEVWNSNHVVTPNGSGLNGDDNATQTALIVPFPDDSSRYYIFTVQDRMSGGDIYYSVFNTGLDGGTGDIETVGKNTFLVENMTEKLVCLQSDCNNEKKLWVVSHERNSNKIFAFPVTSAGVGELVISSAGPIHPYAGENGLTTWTGVLKASPDNSMLAMATLDRSVEWYEFDNTCGTITHIADFPLEAFPDYRGSCYGVCFSPDNTKLYVGESRYKNTWDKDNYLYQYDLSLPTLADIFASKTLLGSPGQEKVVFDIQAGPDGRIYVCKHDSSYLAVVEQPNLAGVSCTYVEHGQFLGPNHSASGLPNEVRVARYGDVPCDCQRLAELEMPNVFTPNGDGKNDVFLPVRHKNTDEYLLVVYNRWGEVVYEASRPEQSWDGRLPDGDQGTDGVYYWVASYRSTLEDVQHQQNGIVSLLK